MRLNSSRIVLVAVSLVLVIALVVFMNRDAMTKPRAVKFTKAEVEVFHARGDRSKKIQKTVTIENADEIEELVKLLPEVGTKQTSMCIGGWVASMMIRFTSQDGTVYEVAVESDYKFYTINKPTTRGDWDVKEPDRLEKFVEQLLKKTQ